MYNYAPVNLFFKNILKVKDIIDIVYEYVETNLSIATIKDYVPYAINIDISTITISKLVNYMIVMMKDILK